MVNEQAVKNLVKNVTNEINYAEEVDGQGIDIETIRPLVSRGVPDEVLQNIVDKIHTVEDQCGIPQDYFEEKFMTYTHLIGKGLPVNKLINAIKFVNLVLMSNITNTKAYEIVFPAKAKQVRGRGEDCSSFATMYAKTKAVKEVMSNSILAPSVEYKPLEPKLLGKLIELSDGRAANGMQASPTVQLNATIAALDYIKAPVENTLNVNLGASDEAVEAQNNLAEQLAGMAVIQKAQLEAGRSITEVQKIGITYGEEVLEAEVIQATKVKVKLNFSILIHKGIVWELK